MTLRADSSTPANTRPAAIVPNWLPVLSGRQPQTNWRSFALRPEGTDDWLLVATTSGRGRVTCSDGDARMLGRGDLLLFRPGAPQDYGFADTTDTWFNTWIHFRPRPSWIEWLGWPEVDRGVSILKAGEDFEPIEVELNRLHDVANGASRLRSDGAMNALERVLILADHFNPKFGRPDMDPRILRALNLVGEWISRPVSVGDLSRASGLSRSQFTALFTRQMRIGPQAYVEKLKLERASQMLRSPRWTIGQVAAAHGFANVFYFSTRFRKQFGLSPSSYRRRHSQDPRDTDMTL